jgi:predicted nucleic acid-binding protein
MNGRYFLDTNLFVYSFDRSSPAKSNRASVLIRQAVASRKGIISYQVVQEFFNLALRRFAQPMTVTEAEQYFTTIFRPLLAVHSSSALYQQALGLSSRYRLAWYDALIVASAQLGEAELLYSEDFQDGQKFGPVRVQNPFK